MYIPFNVKTNYYLLSSLNDIEKLVSKAKSFGIRSLAITDPNMYSTMDFYHICLKNDIKPIIGLDIKIDSSTILLYAMNYEGYQNLTRLIYIIESSTLTYDDLKEHSDNILCILPYTSFNICEKIKNIYKNFYVGYNSLEEKQLLREDSNKLVFVNEVLYLNKEDKKYLNYLYLIRDGKKINNIDDYKKEENNYLMEYDEIKDFVDLKVFDEIDNLCSLEFKQNPNLLPQYNEESSFDPKVYLQSLCKLGLQKRLDNKVPNNYVERLKYELEIIDKMGFNDYFLVVYDFVKYAKTHSIMVGPGRGSAAGSLVSYCLGITDVDPIKYNLFFERFLNPERVTMPDIDIDFESNRRGEVVDYVINKYGKKRAMPIITFVTLGGKQAIRDIARIFDYSTPKLDSLCKLVDIQGSLHDNYKNEKIKLLLITDPELDKIYKIAAHIDGAKRQVSVHAAGIVISKYELDSYIPLKKYNDSYVTGFSYEYLEELGILKMDFLGLKNLTTVEGILNDIEKSGKVVSLKDIPLNDSKTLTVMSEALTEGIFQFESEGMKNFLLKLKPNSFEDITSAIALYRPGPMANIDTFIKRKNGQEKIDYFHKDLESILKPTYGVIVYQEQIMQIANVLAGYSLGEADVLRRAMSKKKIELLEKEKNRFIERSTGRGYDKDTAIKVYNLILKFAGFGFNRSHSVAYALLAYKMAYLKTYYPNYFMCNLLTNVIGNDSKTKIYLDECRALGIITLKPDINLSDYAFKVEGSAIRFPLSSIHNVGGVTSKEIIKEREKGKFLDFFDFVRRTYSKAISKPVVESLIDADVFSSFNYNHQTLIYNLDNAITYAELSSNIDPSLVEKPMIGVVDEMSKEELSKREKHIFGFYLSNHPTLEYKVRYKNIISLNDIKLYFDKLIDVIGYVEKIKEIKTKNNEKMAFLTISDETGSVELVIFPNYYKEGIDISSGDIIKAKVRVEKRLSKYQLSMVNIINLL
jgi:DNA polymerase-3 subunit alpha